MRTGGLLNIYLVIFITLIAALIASAAQLLFKKGLHKKITGMEDFFELLKKPMMLLGVFGYGISLLIYLYALKQAPLSLVYPTFASTFVFVYIISMIWLHEKFSAMRALGIALIFFGILVISFSV